MTNRLDTARIGASAVVYNDRLLVIGGHSGGGPSQQYLATVEELADVNGPWTLFPQLTTPRAWGAAATYHGDIFVTGGRTGATATPTTEVYRDGQWTIVTELEMSSVRFDHGMAVFPCTTALYETQADPPPPPPQGGSVPSPASSPSSSGGTSGKNTSTDDSTGTPRWLIAVIVISIIIVVAICLYFGCRGRFVEGARFTSMTLSKGSSDENTYI